MNIKKKTITVNEIEFKQSTIAPRIWVSRTGDYIIPTSNEPRKIRTGTKSYNKKGYPLQVMVCTTKRVEVNGVEVVKPAVYNLGRLVLDAWLGFIDETLDVDHIDRNCFNNSLYNLRLVPHRVNMLNRRKVNPTWLQTPEVKAKRNASIRRHYEVNNER